MVSATVQRLRARITGTVQARMPVGLSRAAALAYREVLIFKRHRMGVWSARKYASAKSLRLNIGCGPNLKPGWINIDTGGPGVDLTLDMREKIPLPDGSAQTIYSEHFFEHLDYPNDAMKFLRECLRVLKPAGTFRVVVPDTEWPLREYVDRTKTGYLEETAKSKWHPDWCKTFMEHINYHFRQDDEHRFAWDFETMKKALDEVGFAKITQGIYLPEMDTERRKVGSLYVDAVKPTHSIDRK